MLPFSHPLRFSLLRGSNGHAAGGTLRSPQRVISMPVKM